MPDRELGEARDVESSSAGDHESNSEREVLNATEEPQKNLTCSGERSWKFAVDLRL